MKISQWASVLRMYFSARAKVFIAVGGGGSRSTSGGGASNSGGLVVVIHIIIKRTRWC